MLKRSDIEYEHTGLSFFRLEKLLDNNDGSLVQALQQQIHITEPDIVRLKIRSDAEQIREMVYKTWGNRVKYLYTIKRYTFPAITFGSFIDQHIEHQIVSDTHTGTFKDILGRSWDDHFLGYRYNDALRNHITHDMELNALMAYYKRFIPGNPAGHQIWLLKEGHTFTGTCCFYAKTNEMDVLLAGILPEHRHKGFFYQLSAAGRILALKLNKEFITNGVRTNNLISLRFFDQWPASKIVYEDVCCILHPGLLK